MTRDVNIYDLLGHRDKLLAEVEQLKYAIERWKIEEQDYKAENARLWKVTEAAKTLILENPNIDMECSGDNLDDLKKALAEVAQ